MGVPSNPLPHCELFLAGILLNDAGLAAVFAGLNPPIEASQVFSNQAPQETAYPYVLFNYYSSKATLATGEDQFSFETPVYVIKAVTKEGSFANAHRLMKAVEDALRNALGVQSFAGSSVNIQGIRLQPPRIEYTEIDTDGVRVNHVGNYFRLFVSGG